MYTCIKTEGTARRGVFETVHGTIQTPFFMNVGTAAAIKGGISSVNSATPTTCIFVQVIPLSGKWAVCTSLCTGTSRFSQIAADFRCSLSQSCGKSRKRAFISNPILTANEFSWDRKKACRFNLIWLLPLLWHSMNA